MAGSEAAVADRAPTAVPLTPTKDYTPVRRRPTRAARATIVCDGDDNAEKPKGLRRNSGGSDQENSNPMENNAEEPEKDEATKPKRTGSTKARTTKAVNTGTTASAKPKATRKKVTETFVAETAADNAGPRRPRRAAADAALARRIVANEIDDMISD